VGVVAVAVAMNPIKMKWMTEARIMIKGILEGAAAVNRIKSPNFL
jgi:hypothetical protein